MNFSIFKTSTSGTEQIDIQTAFNIANLLNARYTSRESAQMLQNFVHDRDFQLLMSDLLAVFQSQINQLEKEAASLSLKVPSRPSFDIKTSVKINEVTDRYIFVQTFTDMLNELFSLTRSVRSTLTSDRLRKEFTGFLMAHIKLFLRLNKYGKLKGWEVVVPSFKIPKKQGAEALSLAEAYHLWDHLRVRYFNLQLTQFFEGFAHDVDFRAGMSFAVRTLTQQISKLEQFSLKFEVPLPARPPAIMKVAIDPEVMEDKFMYQQLFLGIDNMVEMHIRALIEITRNDDLRVFFTDLFQNELNIHDNMVKYGKMKGWLQTPPLFTQGVNA